MNTHIGNYPEPRRKSKKKPEGTMNLHNWPTCYGGLIMHIRRGTLNASMKIAAAAATNFTHTQALACLSYDKWNC